MKFANRVAVYAAGVVLYHIHSSEASRLVSECQATRASKVRIDLAVPDPGAPQPERHGNPHKHTFRESLGQLHPCACAGSGCNACGGTGEVIKIDAHCHSLKLGVANTKNWPIYRAALVDCLPADKQAKIRELFRPQAKQRRAQQHRKVA